MYPQPISCFLLTFVKFMTHSHFCSYRENQIVAKMLLTFRTYTHPPLCFRLYGLHLSCTAASSKSLNDAPSPKYRIAMRMPYHVINRFTPILSLIFNFLLFISSLNKSYRPSNCFLSPFHYP